MRKWKKFGVAVVVCAVSAFGGMAPTTAEEAASIEQMIVSARTPADHAAIAAYYDKEARAAHEKHAEHHRMAETYAKLAHAGPWKRTGSRAHCEAVASQYEQIAKEYEALAKLHQAMAKTP